MNVFSFYGRVSRLEWWFLNIVPVLIMAFGLLFVLTSIYTHQEIDQQFDSPNSIFNIMGSIISIPITWICFAANAKRFHDLGISGWWQIIWFIPLIGPLLILIVLGFVPGDQEENDFGSPGNGSIFAERNGIFGVSGGSVPTGYFDNDDDQTRSRKGNTNATGQKTGKPNKPVFGRRTNSPLPRK